VAFPMWGCLPKAKVFDFSALLLNKKFAISSIRIQKFCANSLYEFAINKTGFIPPVGFMDAIEKTVNYEFIEDHQDEQVFYTE
jgi:GlcNAc-P-P-Und epimerase